MMPLWTIAPCLAFLLLGCKESVDPLPARMGTLELVSRISGEEARSMIDRLHGRGVAPVISTIGIYTGERAKATLYASEYNAASDADEAEARMRELIQHGTADFSHFHRLKLQNKDVSMCVGMEQVHYFFVSGARMYWLAVDPAVAYATAAGLIDALEGP